MTPSRHVWLVSAVLAACSTPAHWEKAGASAAQVQEDSEQCSAQARLAGPPPRTAPAPSQSTATSVLSRDQQVAGYEAQEFQKCMTGKGYSAKR